MVTSCGSTAHHEDSRGRRGAGESHDGRTGPFSLLGGAVMTNPVVVPIGVGLDTARYGHHASFLREDRQPAAEPFTFQECRSGYEKFEATLRQLAEKHKHRGQV